MGQEKGLVGGINIDEAFGAQDLFSFSGLEPQHGPLSLFNRGFELLSFETQLDLIP